MGRERGEGFLKNIILILLLSADFMVGKQSIEILCHWIDQMIKKNGHLSFRHVSDMRDIPFQSTKEWSWSSTNKLYHAGDLGMLLQNVISFAIIRKINWFHFLLHGKWICKQER